MTDLTKDDIQIYRFKFTLEIMNMLQEFAQIHKYDDKETYKEAWNNWTKENETIIQEEETRLTNLGWMGKIKDKMYKSAKYYFQNKSNEEQEPKKRKIYTRVTINIRMTIDRHILLYNNKPSDGLKHFYEQYEDIIKEEYDNFGTLGFSKQVVDEKIKKTYKNRYFQIIKKIKK
jgi:hypothetical protein